MGCKTTSDLWKETDIVESLWDKSKAIEAWGMKNDLGMYKRVFEHATGKIFELGESITAQDMRRFGLAVKDLEIALSDPTQFSSYIQRNLWTGRALTRRIPQTREFYDTLNKANNYRNNNTGKMNNNKDSMVGELKRAMLSFDGVDITPISGGTEYNYRDIMHPTRALMKYRTNKKFKQLYEYEKEYYRAIQNKEVVGANNELQVLEKFLENEAPVFKDFMDLIEARGDGSEIIKRYDGTNQGNKHKLNEKALSQYMHQLERARQSWGSAATQGKDALIRSLNNISDIAVIKYGDRSSKSVARLKEAHENIIKDLNQFEGGYVPHYVLDVIKESKVLDEKLVLLNTEGGSLSSQSDKLINDYAVSMEGLNLRLSNRLKKSRKNVSEYFSRNPLLYAEKYVTEVAGFNHRSYVDLAYARGLRDLTAVALSGDPKYGEVAKVFKDILHDQYGRAVGTGESTTGDNIVQTLTALQFLGKMGFSARSYIQNRGQGLFNGVWFGTGLTGADAWINLKKAKGDKAYEGLMNVEKGKHGFEFLESSTSTHGVLEIPSRQAKDITYDGSGEFTIHESNKIRDGFVEAGYTIVEASAKMMQWAENKNRNATFEMAFHDRYTHLMNLHKYSKANYSAAEGSEPRNLSKAAAREAGHHASKMVGILHFDYTKYGKSKILTTKTGAVAGQFQHFFASITDLNYNMWRDVVKQAEANGIKHAATSIEAGRLVRMSMYQGLAGLVSVVSGYNVTGFFGNPIYEKVKGIATWLFGDSDESMDALYKKGLISAIGIVPASDAVDILNIGAAAGFYNISKDKYSLDKWLFGIRKLDKMSQGHALYEVLNGRIIPKEAGRLVKTIQSFQEYGFGSAIRNEFGLYQGDVYGFDVRKTNKKIRGKSKRSKLSSKAKSYSEMTRAEREQVLNSLSNF